MTGWFSTLKPFQLRPAPKPVAPGRSLAERLADREHHAEQSTRRLVDRLEQDQERITARKLRLFVCAHLRLVRWNSLNAECQAAVCVAVRLADGTASEEERQNAF